MGEVDPLEELLLDGAEVDRARLSHALKDFLGVDKDSGTLVFRSPFNSLAANRRILAVLLGLKAAVLLGKADKESVPPKDLISMTGMPRGTVHPVLKGLREQRLVSQDESGDYLIPPAQVTEAIQRLRRTNEQG